MKPVSFYAYPLLLCCSPLAHTCNHIIVVAPLFHLALWSMAARETNTDQMRAKAKDAPRSRARHTGKERERERGLLALCSMTPKVSVSTSRDKVDSEASHPLQSEEQEADSIMSAEEQARLLPLPSGSRRSHANRPHTFAGQRSASRSQDDDINGLTGVPDRLFVPPATTSSSWGHPDPRGRLNKPGLGIEPRGSSIPPRPSTLRAASHTGAPSLGTGYEGHTSSRLSFEDEAGVQTWRAGAVGSTPLERTIDAIGMGRYQYAVLILSGLGWAADNMWLQGVAIILPRVQDEWRISDRWIGLVSSCTFAGMMVGALAWGSCEFYCFLWLGLNRLDLTTTASGPLLNRCRCFWSQECL